MHKAPDVLVVFCGREVWRWRNVITSHTSDKIADGAKCACQIAPLLKYLRVLSARCHFCSRNLKNCNIQLFNAWCTNEKFPLSKDSRYCRIGAFRRWRVVDLCSTLNCGRFAKCTGRAHTQKPKRLKKPKRKTAKSIRRPLWRGQSEHECNNNHILLHAVSRDENEAISKNLILPRRQKRGEARKKMDSGINEYSLSFNPPKKEHSTSITSRNYHLFEF